LLFISRVYLKSIILGRFKTETRLCLSISDFHRINYFIQIKIFFFFQVHAKTKSFLCKRILAQQWKPVWSVGSILTGLLSFMLEDTPTTGSIESTVAIKKILAKKSYQTNLQNPLFVGNISIFNFFSFLIFFSNSNFIYLFSFFFFFK